MERRRTQKPAHYWICVFVRKKGVAGKSTTLLSIAISSYEVILRKQEIGLKSLPRKSSMSQSTRVRTKNRHRWVGREAQGERVRDPQGTRQKSGRNLGICPSRCKSGRSESTPGDCLSKTQLTANS